MGVTFQNVLLLQIADESFQNVSEFSSQFSAQNYGWIFEILRIEILMIFFLFSLTWDPRGAKISKRYSSYKSQPNISYKHFLYFLPNGPHKRGFLKF